MTPAIMGRVRAAELCRAVVSQAESVQHCRAQLAGSMAALEALAHEAERAVAAVEAADRCESILREAK